ncbi:MAG: hypothetical protein J6Y29_03240 [Clostridiales bacterium]|nr:hypothetical protein [Clostridiales bacterium]
MITYTLGLIAFILYTLAIFQIRNTGIILVCLVVQIAMLFVVKINMKKFFANLYSILPLLFFTVIFNVIFNGDIFEPLIMGVKILTAWGATNILSQKMPTVVLAGAVANLLYPFRVVGIDIEEITLIITIAISFLPILAKELSSIKNSLAAKNFDFSLKNLMTRPQIFIVTYLNAVFNRIDEIEKSLIAKAFE